MSRTRLDQLLVARGLTPSRERARSLILAGDVSVGGVSVAKAGTLVDDGAIVTLRLPDHPWVGRGGLKLAHALEAFGLNVAGLTALDIGASTGGFTDVLLTRGARRVVALDVGHGQLDWRLRQDPRVVVIEGVNARYLGPEVLPADLAVFDLVTIDVAFISLRQVLPVIPPLLGPGGRVIALVKPQFEAGRDEVGKGGIVRDPEVHARVVAEVTRAAHQVGLERVALEPSPIDGAKGNREFFVLWSCQSAEPASSRDSRCPPQ
jgi:23S rRNA (cytidine1920-2'-O)/16S rRNA (cytidine1409-2'-O)-methyltransferase